MNLWGEPTQNRLLEESRKWLLRNPNPKKEDYLNCLQVILFAIAFLIDISPIKYGHLFDELKSSFDALIDVCPDKAYLLRHDLATSAYKTNRLDYNTLLDLAEKSIDSIVKLYIKEGILYDGLYLNMIELMIAIYDDPLFNLSEREKEKKIQYIALQNIEFAKLIKDPSILEIRYRGEGNLYQHVVLPKKFYEVE